LPSSETASCNSSTKYTTVEVVRPHKAKHHRRKVSVKEVVRSETTEIEVIRPKGQKEKKGKKEEKRGKTEHKTEKKQKRKSTKFSPKKYLKKATAVDCKKK
jgi:hypothetical protein